MSALLAPSPVSAQDAFELEVYSYVTVPRSAWELEAHLNYTADGTTSFDGPVAPTEHQGHLVLELTRGITNHWEVAAYMLSAYRPGLGFEYAGARMRTSVRSPESWGLPVDLSLAAELELTRAAYDENTAGLEITPILGRRFGRVRIDFNPVLERGLRGRGGEDAEGWEFEPKGRVSVTLSRVVDLSVEYYGKTGLLGSTLPGNQQVHQFYPSVDLKLGDDLVIDVGVGFGTTPAGNRLVFKSYVEVPL